MPSEGDATDELVQERAAHFGATPAQLVGKISLQPAVVTVVPQSRQSFLAGLELYRARPDKGYSLVDCISMSTMQSERITEVLTNDRHFEQEGFRALFRDF